MRSSIVPWVILAGSLTVVGFACTRTPQTITTTHHQATRVARALPSASPRSSIAPQTAAPVTPPARPTLEPTPTSTPSAPATAAPDLRVTPTGAGTSQPRLAVIIDDCGQWLDTERGFIALPVALTLSILPDVRFNGTIEREAADRNKGVMLHLPMETLSGLNPGPGKVTTEMDDRSITAQVEQDLADVDLARGVNNHEGSKATASVRVMNDVMSVLSRRDRFFIDSRTNAASVAERVATEHGVATASRDIFLDNRADVAYTERQLRAAIALAKLDGSAIVIGHPRPTTLNALRAMIPEVEADGVKFVLASELARPIH